ncbi:beta-mannosidase [Marinicrinis sediminis]|uniref:Beta-mannosidase B n=1 Tax=Marinicrinis sediminis TaxID=1652465 RepID=A0ABW5RAC5_9BACL
MPVQMTSLIDNWSFKASDESTWHPAQVPGCVHTDLWNNQLIDDPFYGTHEQKLQWIDKKDWEYRTTFEVAAHILSQPHIELTFDGLDTYADVWLNEQHILSADNMFRTWTIDVKTLLKPADNILKIRFRSPILEDLPKLAQLGYALPAINDDSETGELGDQKVSVFARKAPYHYGWDWGPRFVTSGIWKPVRLTAWSEARITDLYLHQQEVTADAAKFVAHIELETDQAITGKWQLETDGYTWEQAVSLSPGIHAIQMEAEIPNPKLWWSRGLGEPHLYQVKASLQRDGQILADRTIRTGLRSIRLVRDRDDAGSTFHFELNGIPVFAKGANHIPNDSFITACTADRYRHEIQTAAASNMNMLRVWGGGVYEYDVFYDLCDEYGILIWQDFMFACSMYPGDEAFLNNVRIEAEQNVKRLRHHPSIAVWCGNNEMDTAWSAYDPNAGWGWKEQYEPVIRDQIWRDYERIFHELLPETVARLTPDIDYWPSSPMREQTGDQQQHSHYASAEGDIHYWGVWHGIEPIENYNRYVGRFMSEYGFQSFPEMKTVRTYAEESDLQLESEVMLAHQKNKRGNMLIKEYMDLYLPKPKDFASFLYMSQILQAMAVKEAMEAHRRHKPHCMGTLYWQLNDCWPVASWASMDYDGRWKALQYGAKSAYQDVMLSFDASNTSQLHLYVVTDLLAQVEGKLMLTLYDAEGRLLREEQQTILGAANTSTRIANLDPLAWLEEHDPTSTVLVATLMIDGQVVDQKMHHFVPIPQSNLKAPELQLEVVAGSGGSSFTITSSHLARHVWLTAEEEGMFSDNDFDLLPGKPKTIHFYGRNIQQQQFQPAQPGRVEATSIADYMA